MASTAEHCAHLCSKLNGIRGINQYEATISEIAESVNSLNDVSSDADENVVEALQRTRETLERAYDQQFKLKKPCNKKVLRGVDSALKQGASEAKRARCAAAFKQLSKEAFRVRDAKDEAQKISRIAADLPGKILSEERDPHAQGGDCRRPSVKESSESSEAPSKDKLRKEANRMCELYKRVDTESLPAFLSPWMFERSFTCNRNSLAKALKPNSESPVSQEATHASQELEGVDPTHGRTLGNIVHHYNHDQENFRKKLSEFVQARVGRKVDLPRHARELQREVQRYRENGMEPEGDYMARIVLGVTTITNDNKSNEIPTLIPIEDISFGDEVAGAPNQCQMYEALWQGMRVQVSMHKGALTKQSLEVIEDKISKLSRIRHPNIVTVYGYTEGNDMFGIVHEPTAGNTFSSLADVVNEKGSSKLSERGLSLALQVGFALHRLHLESTPLVHGKVSAKNVIVNQSLGRAFLDVGCLLPEVSGEAASISGEEDDEDPAAKAPAAAHEDIWVETCEGGAQAFCTLLEELGGRSAKWREVIREFRNRTSDGDTIGAIIRNLEAAILTHFSSADTGIHEAMVPDRFLCPISRQPMVDPVISKDGFTYDRDSVQPLLTSANDCGHDGFNIDSLFDLRPNPSLRAEIYNWFAQCNWPFGLSDEELKRREEKERKRVESSLNALKEKLSNSPSGVNYRQSPNGGQESLDPTETANKIAAARKYAELSNKSYVSELVEEVIAEKEREIMLDGCTGGLMKDEGACAVAEALKVNRSVEIVNLAGNNIGGKGATALFEALAENNRIRELDLRGNRIGEDEAALSVESLSKNKSLVALDLQANSLGTSSAQQLASALLDHDRLCHLDFDKNNAGDSGAYALVKSFVHNNSWRVLGLEANGLSSKGLAQLIKLMEENEHGFTRIYLKGNAAPSKDVRNRIQGRLQDKVITANS